MNNIRKETPKSNGINVNACIVLPSVVQLDAPAGLENVVAIPSPLAPNIKNTTPKNKKAIGIPNNSVIICLILISPVLKSFSHLMRNSCSGNITANEIK